MLTLILMSSDGYSDCWDPFFELFHKRFPKIKNMELLLSTNSKSYSYKDLDIKVLQHGKDISWSERLLLSLEKAKFNIILPISEDLLLRTKINEKVFLKVLDLISGVSEIDHIRLLNKGVYDTFDSEFEYLDQISYKTKRRFTYAPGLWKKEVLKKYIVDYENPWQAEKMADFRSKIFKDGFYTISMKYVEKYGQLYDTFSSGVIYKGKCAYYVEPFLNKEGFTKILERGIMSKEDMKRVRKRAKWDLLRYLPSVMKSFSNIVYLKMKNRNK